MAILGGKKRGDQYLVALYQFLLKFSRLEYCFSLLALSLAPSHRLPPLHSSSHLIFTSIPRSCFSPFKNVRADDLSIVGLCCLSFFVFIFIFLYFVSYPFHSGAVG